LRAARQRRRAPTEACAPAERSVSTACGDAAAPEHPLLPSVAMRSNDMLCALLAPALLAGCGSAAAAASEEQGASRAIATPPGALSNGAPGGGVVVPAAPAPDTPCPEEQTRCAATGRCYDPGCAECCAPGVDTAREPCGARLCGAGLVCCNSSCGACVPPGGVCTEQYCADAGFPAAGG
jgi:hypothetical protein